MIDIRFQSAEDPADRAERLYESERDAQAVAETRAEDAEPFDEFTGPVGPMRRSDR